MFLVGLLSLDISEFWQFLPLFVLGARNSCFLARDANY